MLRESWDHNNQVMTDFLFTGVSANISLIPLGGCWKTNTGRNANPALSLSLSLSLSHTHTHTHINTHTSTQGEGKCTMQSPSRLGPEYGHGIMAHGLQGHGNNNQRVEFRESHIIKCKGKGKRAKDSYKDIDVRWQLLMLAKLLGASKEREVLKKFHSQKVNMNFLQW